MNPMKDTNLRKLPLAVVEAVVGVVQRKDIGEVMIVSQSQKALHLVKNGVKNAKEKDADVRRSSQIPKKPQCHPQTQMDPRKSAESKSIQATRSQ